MTRKQECAWCGRKATSGIIAKRCVNISACNRRAIRQGRREPFDRTPTHDVLPWIRGGLGTPARYMGESNVRALRTQLRQLQGLLDRLSVSWELVNSGGDPDAVWVASELKKFGPEVIDAAFEFLDNNWPTEMEMKYRANRRYP